MKGLRHILFFASLLASMLLFDSFQKQQTINPQVEVCFDCGTLYAPSIPIQKEFTTRELAMSSGPKTITFVSGVPSIPALQSFLKRRVAVFFHFPPFENHPAVRSFYSTGNIRI